MNGNQLQTLKATIKVLRDRADALESLLQAEKKPRKPGITVTKKKNGPLRPGQNLTQGDGRGMNG